MIIELARGWWDINCGVRFGTLGNMGFEGCSVKLIVGRGMWRDGRGGLGVGNEVG